MQRNSRLHAALLSGRRPSLARAMIAPAAKCRKSAAGPVRRGWWMAVLRRLGVPFKAVVELSRRATDEQHAAHAIRLVQRCGPDAVIVGNELNAVDLRPRVDAAAEIERYLDRYAAIHAAVRAEAPATQIQLYGEAYDGDPRDRGAFLRRGLAAG